MEIRYPKPWKWENEQLPRPLSNYASAPAGIGFYELGFVHNGVFDAQYAGRAKGVTLRQRLHKHFTNSHNKNVRENRDKLFFRCKEFETEELVAYVEAVSIAALDYPWNQRNEWGMHWALEY